MWIDLRYLIVVGAFYAPGLAMLIGAWMLGYATLQVREVVATIGLILGFTATVFTVVALFADGQPIWFRIGGKRHD